MFKRALYKNDISISHGTPPEPEAYLESLLLPEQLDREFFLREYSLTD